MDNMYSYPLGFNTIDTSNSNSSSLYQATQMNSPINSTTPGMSMTASAYMTSSPHNTRPSPSMAGRKRASPEALVPMDAPTQSRRYITPSSTSKKEIPSFFLKRHSHSAPSDEEDDELTEEPPAANATDQEKIEYKRRQNTLAARRSRKRKMMYTHQLEATVERLTMEKEMWKTRALTLRNLLHGHGITSPDFRDD